MDEEEEDEVTQVPTRSQSSAELITKNLSSLIPKRPSISLGLVIVY